VVLQRCALTLHEPLNYLATEPHISEFVNVIFTEFLSKFLVDVFLSYVCMLQYDLREANNTFRSRFGDRVGWTFLTDYALIKYTHIERESIYFYDFENGPPVVGVIATFNPIKLPSAYSIAVRLDLSKFIIHCTFL